MTTLPMESMLSEIGRSPGFKRKDMMYNHRMNINSGGQPESDTQHDGNDAVNENLTHPVLESLALSH